MNRKSPNKYTREESIKSIKIILKHLLKDERELLYDKYIDNIKMSSGNKQYWITQRNKLLKDIGIRYGTNMSTNTVLNYIQNRNKIVKDQNKKNKEVLTSLKKLQSVVKQKERAFYNVLRNTPKIKPIPILVPYEEERIEIIEPTQNIRLELPETISKKSEELLAAAEKAYNKAQEGLKKFYDELRKIPKVQTVKIIVPKLKSTEIVEIEEFQPVVRLEAPEYYKFKQYKQIVPNPDIIPDIEAGIYPDKRVDTLGIILPIHHDNVPQGFIDYEKIINYLNEQILEEDLVILPHDPTSESPHQLITHHTYNLYNIIKQVKNIIFGNGSNVNSTVLKLYYIIKQDKDYAGLTEEDYGNNYSNKSGGGNREFGHINLFQQEELTVEEKMELIRPQIYSTIHYKGKEEDLQLTMIVDRNTTDELLLRMIDYAYTTSQNYGDTSLFFGFKFYQFYAPTAEGDKVNDDVINSFRAFNSGNNRKFQNLTIASTPTDNNLCIYFTFMYCINRFDLTYKNKSKIKHYETIFEEEPEEIKIAVRAGELVKSLQLLTIKYSTIEEPCMIICCFYGFSVFYDEDNNIIFDKSPICFTNGKIHVFENCLNSKKFIEYAISLENTRIILYDEKGQHVAPTIFKKIMVKNSKDKKILIEREIRSNYRLRVKNLEKFTGDYDNVLAFDMETFSTPDYRQEGYDICVYGKLKGHLIEPSFYGINCCKDFITWINVSVIAKSGNTKTHAHGKTPKVFMYAFNNSNYDNFFIFVDLLKKDPNTKINYHNGSIKSIKYFNLRIYDLRMYYTIGTLGEVAKNFGLTETKGVFPYRFAKLDTLYYRGVIPPFDENKYWNTKADYDEYIKNELDLSVENYNVSFDMQKYTTKYCKIDTKLVYDMVIKHLENCYGTIVVDGKEKHYNVADYATVGRISVEMFTQVFQKEDLWQIDDDILVKCELAYKGGRVLPIRKFFKATSRPAFFYDIKSSYPSQMTKPMPYKFKKCIKINETKHTVNDLKPHYLYLSKVKYTGNDPHFIPNILIRTETGNLLPLKETEYAYHWGCELIEACKNDCEVVVNEVNMFETKIIFKEFAEYFFNKRNEAKKQGNLSLAEFCKTCNNSLYGKFGTKDRDLCGIAKNLSDVEQELGGNLNLLTSIEQVGEVWLYKYRNLNCQRQNIGKLVNFASYITALGRCQLSEAIRIVGHKSIITGDTDSICTDVALPNEMIGKNLGNWNLEKLVYEALVAGKKTYAVKYVDVDKEEGFDAKNIDFEKYDVKNISEFKTAIKSKGVKPSLFQFNDFEKMVFQGEKIEKEINMFTRNLDGVYVYPETIRTIQTTYDDRKFFNNGYSEAFLNITDYKSFYKMAY